MISELGNDLLQYNTFSSRSLTTKNKTAPKGKDLPSQTFQGGKQKYKITNINEISNDKKIHSVKNVKINENKENKKENANKIENNKIESFLKLDRLKEKLDKLEITTTGDKKSQTKINLDVMNYMNNYDTQYSKKRVEDFFSYRRVEEKRKNSSNELEDNLSLNKK